LFARFALFLLKTFNLHRQAAVDFIAAGDFVAQSRFAPDGFKLLLPELLNRAFFCIAAIGQVAQAGSGSVEIKPDDLFLSIDTGQLELLSLTLSRILLEFF